MNKNVDDFFFYSDPVHFFLFYLKLHIWVQLTESSLLSWSCNLCNFGKSSNIFWVRLISTLTSIPLPRKKKRKLYTSMHKNQYFVFFVSGVESFLMYGLKNCPQNWTFWTNLELATSAVLWSLPICKSSASALMGELIACAIRFCWCNHSRAYGRYRWHLKYVHREIKVLATLTLSSLTSWADSYINEGAPTPHRYAFVTHLKRKKVMWRSQWSRQSRIKHMVLHFF